MSGILAITKGDLNPENSIQASEYFWKYLAEILVDVFVGTPIDIMDEPVQDQLPDQRVTLLELGKGISFRVENRGLGRGIPQQVLVLGYDPWQ